MMRLLLNIPCVFVCVLAVPAGPGGQGGLFRGGADLTPLLKNKRVVDVQLRCVQDAGPCDGFGNLLKRESTIMSLSAEVWILAGE